MSSHIMEDPSGANESESPDTAKGLEVHVGEPSSLSCVFCYFAYKFASHRSDETVFPLMFESSVPYDVCSPKSN